MTQALTVSNTHRFWSKPVEHSTDCILAFLHYFHQYWTLYFRYLRLQVNKKAKQALLLQLLREAMTSTPLSFMVSSDVNLTTF